MSVMLPQNGLRREENGFGLTRVLYLSDLCQANLYIKIWTFLLPQQSPSVTLTSSD